MGASRTGAGFRDRLVSMREASPRLSLHGVSETNTYRSRWECAAGIQVIDRIQAVGDLAAQLERAIARRKRLRA